MMVHKINKPGIMRSCFLSSKLFSGSKLMDNKPPFESYEMIKKYLVVSSKRETK